MPDESIVETLCMLISTFVAPLFITSCTALRSCTSPEPMVILPLRSRMVTSPTCRLLTSILRFPPLSLAGVRLRAGEALAQRHDRSAAGAGAVLNLVHELFHEQDAPAVRQEPPSRGQRIGDLRGIEPRALVLHPDHQLLPFDRQVHVDLLRRVLGIAVLDRVGQ